MVAAIRHLYALTAIWKFLTLVYSFFPSSARFDFQIFAQLCLASARLGFTLS
jgi:hypothetical protein